MGCVAPSVLAYVAGLAAIYFALERIKPGWKLPRVRTWPFRVVLINLAQIGIVLLAGASWDRWLASWSLFHLQSQLSPAAGGFAAYFVSTFIFYWWHRWRHRFDFLWRGFHQVHHSPQRIEVVTSFYKHPLEMVANSIISSLLVYTLLGLDARAAAFFMFCCASGEFFYHSNLKTPHWVGYFFQRPEMHRIHHEYARHESNYSDVPWWDMLFGTYENPHSFENRCGFDPNKEEQLAPMLLFRDVNR